MKKIVALLTLIITITFVSCGFEPITTTTSTSTEMTVETTVETSVETSAEQTTQGTTVENTTQETTTQETTAENSTTSTTELVTTTDERHIVIFNEFTTFESLLPTNTSVDFTLPTISNENITVLFFQDGIIFEDNIQMYRIKESWNI